MTRDEFRQSMNNFKKARENNPQLSYWEWKVNKYENGTNKEGIEDKRNYVINWFIQRQNYSNPLVQSQVKNTLDRAEMYKRLGERDGKAYYLNNSIYTVPVTTSNDMNQNWGGYYHPNEGVVLPTDYNTIKNREPVVHEFSHTINSFSPDIKRVINNIQNGVEIYDHGEYNQYLTQPQEVHSRLMEFRKLNNLDPTKSVTYPQLQKIKKSGKDADLFNLYKDDQVILDLLNNVALNDNNHIIRVSGGTDKNV